MAKIVLGSFIFLAQWLSVFPLDNGLLRTPPMGFMTWQTFECNIDCAADPFYCLSEKNMMEVADAVVETGLRDVGYNQISIDDCWAEMDRDENDQLVADRKRFPSGLKALGDYFHSNDLKFGHYYDIGTFTCQHYPGALGHEASDVAQLVEWGVDYLKLDGCFANDEQRNIGYPLMTQLLNGTNIAYSCSWPAYQDVDWNEVAKDCNLWREYRDMTDEFATITDIIHHWATLDPDVRAVGGPGNWHDPDMLIVGKPWALTVSQAQIQFATWAVLSAPLFIGADPRVIPDEHLEILMNTEVIEINQDPLGAQGIPFILNSLTQVWVKTLANGDWGVVVINLQNINHGLPDVVNFAQVLGVSDVTTLSVRDLFKHEELGQFRGSVTLFVEPQSCVALRISRRDVVAGATGVNPKPVGFDDPPASENPDEAQSAPINSTTGPLWVTILILAAILVVVVGAFGYSRYSRRSKVINVDSNKDDVPFVEIGSEAPTGQL